MRHDTTSPTLVVADDRRFEIVHSSMLAPELPIGGGAGGREGWYYRPEEDASALTGPVPTFEQAAAKLEAEIGAPDYTAFLFGADADTAEFERTLPSDYVHTGHEILIPTIPGLERIAGPRRWLEAQGIPHLVAPAGYRQQDLFPDDGDEDDDEDDVEGPRP